MLSNVTSETTSQDTSMADRVAMKGNWQTKPFTPEKTVKIQLNQKINKKKTLELKKGIIPQQMEDKWFVYYEDSYLYCHRSWTGILIYKMKLEPDSDESIIITEVEINADNEDFSADPSTYIDEAKYFLRYMFGIRDESYSPEGKNPLGLWSHYGRSMRE